MNRTLSRSLSGKKRGSNGGGGRHRFSISTFRGLQQPQLSKKMNRVIKGENGVIVAHESAARQRVSVAAQISDWGESAEDEAVSDISDKLGVLMAEMGELEDIYAQNLEEYRSILKHIRDTEGSIQPTREYRSKVADEVHRLKTKEPNSAKLETLEQELVRAEAQNLVAEAQLINVTRQRFKEAFDVHLAAVIERGEKQILLARHGRRLLNCLDDKQVVPGDEPKSYDRAAEAQQIIEEAERDLRSWRSTAEPIEIGGAPATARGAQEAPAIVSQVGESQVGESQVGEPRMVEPPMAPVAESQLGEPQIAEPQITEPHIAKSQIAEPHIAEPQITEPHIAKPHAAEPLMAEPQVAGYQTAEPKVAGLGMAEHQAREYPSRVLQEAQADEFQDFPTEEDHLEQGGEEESFTEEERIAKAVNPAPPERVHTITAPTMDADAMKEAPAGPEPSAGGTSRMDGVNSAYDAYEGRSGSPKGTRDPVSAADFIVHAKEDEPPRLVGALGTQAQSVAVPI